MLNQHQIVRRMFNHERDEAAEFDSCLKRFRIQYVADIGSDILEPEVQANIVDHVTNGRPAAIQIHWRGGSSVGHVVCAFGVQQTSRGDAFWIYDPSGKDNDDDNEKLFPISEMTRYEDGLGKGTTGSWVAAFRITAP